MPSPPHRPQWGGTHLTGAWSLLARSTGPKANAQSRFSELPVKTGEALAEALPPAREGPGHRRQSGGWRRRGPHSHYLLEIMMTLLSHRQELLI